MCSNLIFNVPLKERIERSGDPGGLLIIDECISSGEKSTFPPRWFFLYQMKMFLNAFSLEQEPHIIVVTCLSPFGATWE